MNRHLFILLSFLIAGIFCSCKDEYSICNQPKNVAFSASFYQKISGVELAATAPNLKILLLSNNTVIFSNQTNVGMFTLNLDPLKDTSRYIISLGNSMPIDTVSIVYTSQSVLVSPECGVISTSSITKIITTINSIDSIKILSPTVNTAQAQNAKIYF